MDDIVSSPPPPNLKKRATPHDESPGKKPLNLKGNQFVMPTPPDTEESSNASPDVSLNNGDTARAASPAPSSSTISSTVEITSSNIVPSSLTTPGSSAAPTASSGAPPAKRRKLTPSEKLEKQKAKEARDQEKAEKKARQEEEKARKDQEKARKDEEKRVKDEEKRKKAEEREAKKREKELEEERKVQEKQKKERSQMRLGAFFQKPATSANNAADNENQPRARRRSLSLELYDNVKDDIKRSASPSKGTPPPASARKPVISDYHRTFLPFELKPHTTIAPRREHSDAAQAVFDGEIKDPSLSEQYDLGIVASYSGHADIQHFFTAERGLTRGIPYQSARELVDLMQGTSTQVIDLTGDSKPDSAVERLRDLPMKHIQFEVDVRPAYCGTYTKIRSPRTIRKFRANPELKARPDTNYDYDSEAEWEEPEEGDEEIGSEDGDDADSAADPNDIDDFLDDEEDDAKNKRKMITGELVPECTGLCWANQSGRIGVVESIEVHEQPPEMSGMRMGLLLPGFTGMTIDPFSTSYWDNPKVSSTQPAPDRQISNNVMAPPRPPLQPRLNGNGSPSHDLVGAAEGQKGPITFVSATQAAKRGPKPAPKTLSKEDLDEFKEAVVDSPLGKLELQKALKARFPKLTNEVIKETLSSQFAQVGKGKDNKRWVFVGLPPA